MRLELHPYIAGLGIIFYSPFAVAHINPGSDYLRTSFWNPADVARHVVNCEIACVCTGNPGDWYHIVAYDGNLDQVAMQSAKYAIRLGVEIRDQTLCFRDLNDFLNWNPQCPPEQQFTIDDGYYRVTAYTTPQGIDAGDKNVYLHFEKTGARPQLKWDGVPQLV
jgi:hypothetical protein